MRPEHLGWTEERDEAAHQRRPSQAGANGRGGRQEAAPA
jgi:hypothetical protein